MRKWSWILVVAAVLFSADSALARMVTVDVMRNDVRVHTPEDETLGAYHTFGLAIPARLPAETFMHAYLELYVDATTTVDEVAAGGIATLEVYPLRSALLRDVQESDLRPASMKRTVHLGESRRVKVDIGEHVRYLLEHPPDDFGLAVGSLSGQRLGVFTLKHGVLGPGVVARVTIVFQELEAPGTARR